MQLFLPQNIFGKLIADNLLPECDKNINYMPSSLLSKTLKDSESAVALIPTSDLIQNKDFFVSKKFGLSFEGGLCNSYFYFIPGQKEISEIALVGDVSSVEVIFSKILFKEIYNTDVGIKIVSDDSRLNGLNYLESGDKNFFSGKFLDGISFAEEIIDALNLPFVNYVFASKEKSLIEKINGDFLGLGNRLYDYVESDKHVKYFSLPTSNYIKENISSLVIDFEQQDLEGITQLIQLPYFHGIINDIVEVNFV
jgi:hypothetical protein